MEIQWSLYLFMEGFKDTYSVSMRYLLILTFYISKNDIYKKVLGNRHERHQLFTT